MPEESTTTQIRPLQEFTSPALTTSSPVYQRRLTSAGDVMRDLFSRNGLSHRDRFVGALNHREPDRVSMAFGGPSCSIHKLKFGQYA
jgi:hypothetical protein